MEKKKILVDMDGILSNLLQKWLDDYNSEHSDQVSVSDILTWETSDHTKIGKRMYAIPGRHRYFDDLDPIPGAIEGFTALKRAGHEVLICSSPYNPCSARAKYEWCKRHLGAATREVMLTHKKDWLAAHVDAIIDDKPSTIEAFHAAGKEAVTIAYPYNAAVADKCALRAEGHQDFREAWEQIVAYFC